MKKTPKQSPSKSNTKRTSDKQLDANKLAHVTGGTAATWGRI